VASEKGHWKPGLWMGTNKLHEGSLGVVEGIEDSGLKLGYDSAKELGRRGVMAGGAGKMTESVRVAREDEDDDSRHIAGVAVAGRDVRIDGT
jgi:hypothetical protein